MDDSHSATCRKPSSKTRAKKATLSYDAAGGKLYMYESEKAAVMPLLTGGFWEAGGSKEELPTNPS